MNARLVVILFLAAAWALAACQSYGYVYDYDPYLGPRGHYVGPFEGHGRQAGLACARTVYAGPYERAWRGPYDAGPFCAEPPAPPAR